MKSLFVFQHCSLFCEMSLKFYFKALIAIIYLCKYLAFLFLFADYFSIYWNKHLKPLSDYVGYFLLHNIKNYYNLRVNYVIR